MNEKQLKLIAHAIALASQLPYNMRLDFENEIITEYKDLEDD